MQSALATKIRYSKGTIRLNPEVCNSTSYSVWDYNHNHHFIHVETAIASLLLHKVYVWRDDIIWQ